MVVQHHVIPSIHQPFKSIDAPDTLSNSMYCAAGSSFSGWKLTSVMTISPANHSSSPLNSRPLVGRPEDHAVGSEPSNSKLTRCKECPFPSANSGHGERSKYVTESMICPKGSINFSSSLLFERLPGKVDRDKTMNEPASIIVDDSMQYLTPSTHHPCSSTLSVPMFTISINSSSSLFAGAW